MKELDEFAYGRVMKARETDIKARPKKPLVLFLVVSSVWLTFCFLIIGMIIVNNQHETKITFQEANSQRIGRIADRILIAETALEGFTSNLLNQDIDYSELTQVAQRLLKRHPFLYKVEVAQRVDDRNRSSVEEELGKIYPKVHIRRFDYSQTREWVVSEQKEFYYPLVFQEPHYEDHRSAIGLDISSSGFLAQAMEQSNAKGIPMASRPFKLAEGTKGYVLHRAVNKGSRKQSTWGNQFYSLLVVVSDEIFGEPYSETDSQQSYLSVRYSDSPKTGEDDHILFQKGTRLNVDNGSWLFPILSYQRFLGESIPSQPFMVEAQYQVTLSDYNADLITLFLVFSVLIPIFFRVYGSHLFRYELMKVDDKEQLYFLANFDQLTGLPNRTRLSEHLKALEKKSLRRGTEFSVLFVDIDNFKSINDNYGHDAGDCVLRALSTRISAHLREYELLARLAGDEFILVIDEKMSDATLQAMKFRLRKLCDNPISYNEVDINVDFSIGEATFPLDGSKVEDLMHKADKEMYREKHERKRPSD